MPGTSTGYETAKSVKEKERKVEVPFPTPPTSKNVGEKRLEDHFAYKDRGRYGKAHRPAQYAVRLLMSKSGRIEVLGPPSTLS